MSITTIIKIKATKSELSIVQSYIKSKKDMFFGTDTKFLDLEKLSGIKYSLKNHSQYIELFEDVTFMVDTCEIIDNTLTIITNSVKKSASNFFKLLWAKYPKLSIDLKHN